MARPPRAPAKISKGDETRRRVLAEAASLFNTVGYHAGSMQDLMAATGLQKGGIYRHFPDKETLSLEAYRYAVELMTARFAEALAGRTGAIEQLLAIVSVFERLPIDPPVPGGCPTLNAAVEADDGNPRLRDAARRTMHGLKRAIVKILEDGARKGELRAGLDHKAIADVLVVQMEGAVMLSKLEGSQAPMRHVIEHVRTWLQSLRRPAPPSPPRRPRRGGAPPSPRRRA